MKTFEQLWLFLSHTLLHVQQDHDYLKDCCHQAVAELVALGYITLETGAHPDDSSYSITVLGQATYRGQCDVQESELSAVFHGPQNNVGRRVGGGSEYGLVWCPKKAGNQQ